MLDPHVGSTSICAHHAVIVASTCGVNRTFDQVLARGQLGGLVAPRAVPGASSDGRARGGAVSHPAVLAPLHLRSARCLRPPSPWSMITNRSGRRPRLR